MADSNVSFTFDTSYGDTKEHVRVVLKRKDDGIHTVYMADRADCNPVNVGELITVSHYADALGYARRQYLASCGGDRRWMSNTLEEAMKNIYRHIRRSQQGFRTNGTAVEDYVGKPKIDANGR